MKIKILISVFVIIGAIGYMIYTTMSSGEALEYFKHVDEVAQSPQNYQGMSLKLHGNIVEKSIIKKKNTLDFRFALYRHNQWIDVSYSGIVPDAFRDCAEIVVKGKLLGDHHFKAESISAKCPSKYDEKRQSSCGKKLLQKVLAYRQNAKSHRNASNQWK